MCFKNRRIAEIRQARQISQKEGLACWHSEIGVSSNLARTAGVELLKLFGGDADAKVADRVAHTILIDGLQAAFPGDRLVSEEGEVPKQMSREHHWWLLDPIDGSKYFALRCSGWSVMIAIIYEGRPIFGLVHEPLSQRLWFGIVGVGAWEEGICTPLQVTHTERANQFRLVVKPMNETNGWLSQLRTTLKPLSVRHLGSVGLRACSVACGEADLQVHPEAGLKTWDTAAGEAIVLAAGGFCTDMNGMPLQYDRPLQPHSSGTLIGNACGYSRIIV